MAYEIWGDCIVKATELANEAEFGRVLISAESHAQIGYQIEGKSQTFASVYDGKRVAYTIENIADMTV